ncbi:hypothetical protein JZU56_00540, partial [bacterium]|nr:hypothetical protein [bacterium]
GRHGPLELDYGTREERAVAFEVPATELVLRPEREEGEQFDASGAHTRGAGEGNAGGGGAPPPAALSSLTSVTRPPSHCRPNSRPQ